MSKEETFCFYCGICNKRICHEAKDQALAITYILSVGWNYIESIKTTLCPKHKDVFVNDSSY